jgi:two-component system chemotaxis response regulator CheB
MDALRVAVVDDSALFRTVLRNVFSELPECELVASIGDPKTAVDKIAELRPDLVTLDVEMPDVSGLDILRELKRRRLPTKVVMVSRLTAAGAQVTTDALIDGAFDFILKPSGGSPAENKATLRNALAEKIAMLRHNAAPGLTTLPMETAEPSDAASASKHMCRAVIIGCSTGGPDALAHVIPDLPATLPVPVFIVQHMPEGFTTTLAARLNEASQLEVLEVSDGLLVRPGQAVIARGGRHLQLVKHVSDGIVVQLSEAPHEHGCRPAVDFTLRSAVDLLGGDLLAVILTGMGRDGTAGCQQVKDRGGQVLAQHAEGCTVFGMPKSIIQAQLANAVPKLTEMAAAISRRTRSKESRAGKAPRS